MNRYAIVGMGFIYPRHVKSINETGGQVLMTCDIDPSKNSTFTDWKEMFNSEGFKDVDAVIICTPNYLHAEIAVEALKRGKKVLCEKPLCIDTKDLKFLEGVNTVLQLRHHPQLQGLKPKQVEVIARMYRDETYWNGWKGDKEKSGGVAFNLGIHYVDLLIFLLGNPKRIISSKITKEVAWGSIEFERGYGSFHIEIVPTREWQDRYICVDGKLINLSDKDNLSYEDLHTEVYKSFMKGEGIQLSEARKSLELVHDLYNYGE